MAGVVRAGHVRPGTGEPRLPDRSVGVVTPRTFWDQDGYLWEVSSERPDLARSVWSVARQESIPSLGYVSKWWPLSEVSRTCGPLVATC